MPEPVTMVGFAGGAAVFLGHMARSHFDYAKEIFDVALGVVAFIVALPVLLLCVLLIKCSSKGPVVFTQVRVGKNNQLFCMYKFRTMHCNAEAENEAVWAQKSDPRVIKTCRWMRISHIDELPQLINVIKGDMSLIGPRPERPEIMKELEKHYPDIRQRLMVKPGITGLAQIRSGYDTSVEAFRNKLENDLEYIRKRRWRLELKILLGTLSKFYDRKAH